MFINDHGRIIQALPPFYPKMPKKCAKLLVFKIYKLVLCLLSLSLFPTNMIMIIIMIVALFHNHILPLAPSLSEILLIFLILETFHDVN